MNLVKNVDYSVAMGLSGVLKAHRSSVICCQSESVINVLTTVHEESLPLYNLQSLEQAIIETKC